MKAIYMLVPLLELAAALQSLPRQQRTRLNEAAANEEEVKPCFWKHPSPQKFWQPRVPFEDLEVGQKMEGVVFQELLKAKTGAKMFMDCGVGRIDKNGDWQIVTGMHRIRDRKQSVITKRAARLRKKKEGIDLWVSRIYAPSYQFEVVVREEDLPNKNAEPKIPVSSLKVDQELVGTVVRVESYGAIVDVGANRNGLLHIQRVADLVGHYVDKEEGLVEEGLEKGAKIRVAVASNEKKRLFLDFTADVKKKDEKELVEEKEEEPTQSSNAGMSEEELAAWAEFAAGDEPPVASASVSTSDSNVYDDDAAAWAAAPDADDFDDDESEDDDYDEDRDIEDAFGIGMY